MAGPETTYLEPGAPQPSAPPPSGQAHRPGLSRRSVLAAALCVVLPLLGALLDEAQGAGLGWAFAGSVVIGSAAAAAVVTRAGLWWVAFAPPPVVAWITLVFGYAFGPLAKGHNATATQAARWAVHAFPVMAWAEAAVLAVVVLRMLPTWRARFERWRRG